MRFVSLFAGVGGFDLGFEAAGMTCVGQVEIDPWCRMVLEKHWPDVPRWGDIRLLDPKELPEHDVLVGGFPCVDTSHAGRRRGIHDGDEGSALWREFARLVRGVRPGIVVVENPTGLLARGMGRVLGDLAEIGYDAEWSSLSACQLGYTHTRERLFVVAYPHGSGRNRRPRFLGSAGWAESPNRVAGSWAQGTDDPGVRRVAYGVPRRVDRIGALGRAVVPQVAEWIGRRLMEQR